MTATADAAPTGLVHAAVLCADPDELARLTADHLRTALAGHAVAEVILDRRGVRAFRDLLGDDAERLEFPSPASLASSSVIHHLDEMGRGVVVGRVSANDPGPDGDTGEDAVTLLLAEHPLTMICPYDPDDPAELARALAHHPWLLDDEGLHRNPDFRPPSASSPVPVALLGSSVATLTVPDGSALAALRRQVADVAREAGLEPERAEAIVLAAHEAMLFASGADLRSDLLPGEHVLDVRVNPAAVVTECRGNPPSGTPLVPVEDPRFVHLRRFCDHATVHADREGRLVRVLTGTPR